MRRPSRPESIPSFASLSPDMQYRLMRQWQYRDWCITALSSSLSLAMLAIMTIPAVNAAAEGVIASLIKGAAVEDSLPQETATDFSAPVVEGELVASYPVTSGYGMRDVTGLPEGASADHRGVDLATPTGTPLYAPAGDDEKVNINCWQDTAGGGLVADIKSAHGPTLQALHLKDCTTGMIKGGEVFATTGNSGIGAEHLDWRQRDRDSNQHQHPQKHYLLWALTGQEPAAALSNIDILRNAIISQESNADSKIVNKDSGALGLGQVMPENLAPIGEDGEEIHQSGWDYEALGEDLTAEEFLADGDKQTRIINHQLYSLYQQQLNEGHSPDEAIKRTAAAWYSGNPDKANDPAPQPWKDSETGEVTDYPSVKDYSDQVLKRVKALDAG